MRLTLLAVALSLLCINCGQAPVVDAKAAEAKAADTRAKDLADIKALEERYMAAFNARDVKALMSLYVPDESLVAFDAAPPRQYVGAAAYTKDWEGLLALFPGALTASLSDLDIAVGGYVAWSHSIQHVIGTMKDGKTVDFTVRVTDGYKRVNGQWLIAHEHVSTPVDLLTEKADITSKP